MSTSIMESSAFFFSNGKTGILGKQSECGEIREKCGKYLSSNARPCTELHGGLMQASP